MSEKQMTCFVCKRAIQPGDPVVVPHYGEIRHAECPAMSEKIEKALTPALSPEEWRTLRFEQPDSYYPQFGSECEVQLAPEGVLVSHDWVGDDGGSDGAGFNIHSRRHALAALALHQQPFGFRHNDVAMLRTLANENPSWSVALGRLADRIESLLPPVEPERSEVNT